MAAVGRLAQLHLRQKLLITWNTGEAVGAPGAYTTIPLFALFPHSVESQMTCLKPPRGCPYFPEVVKEYPIVYV